MKKIYWILSLAITTCVNSLFAQKSEMLPEEDSKRFSLGFIFGTGHGRANIFNNQAIADFGYSSLSSTGVGQIDLNYMLSEKISINGGFAGQSLDLRYVFEDNEYRYNGIRAIIPLGLRIHLGSETSPGKIILGSGGYYSFDTGTSLVLDNNFEKTNIFNGFGLWTTLGFSYAITDEIGFNAAINSISDLTANTLRTRSGFISIGTYVKL
jgi:hypothetical protein